MDEGNRALARARSHILARGKHLARTRKCTPARARSGIPGRSEPLAIPDTNIDAPDPNIDLPDPNIDLPDPNIDVPDPNIDVPDTNIDVPDSITSPRIPPDPPDPPALARRGGRLTRQVSWLAGMPFPSQIPLCTPLCSPFRPPCTPLCSDFPGPCTGVCNSLHAPAHPCADSPPPPCTGVCMGAEGCCTGVCRAPLPLHTPVQRRRMGCTPLCRALRPCTGVCSVFLFPAHPCASLFRRCTGVCKGFLALPGHLHRGVQTICHVAQGCAESGCTPPEQGTPRSTVAMGIDNS